MCATRSLNHREQAEIIATLEHARDRLLLLLGLHSGFRIHELLSVRVGDVWKENRPATEITVARRQLKGGASANARRVRSRTTPLHPAVQAAIRTYVQERFAAEPVRADEFLFKSRKGPNTAITPRHAWRIIKEAARAAGFPDRVATHSMRKTFARAIYDRSGHDLILTQRALDHRSVVTTSRYLESAADDVAAAILGIGDAMPVWPPTRAKREEDHPPAAGR